MKKLIIGILLISVFLFPLSVFGEVSGENEDILIVADASNNKTPVFYGDDTANLRTAFGLYPGANGRFFFNLSNENLTRTYAGNSVICFDFQGDSCTVSSSCRPTAPKTDTAAFLQRSVSSGDKTVNYYLQVSYGYSDEEEISSAPEEVISEESSSLPEVTERAPFPVLPVVLCIIAVLSAIGIYLYIKFGKTSKEDL